MTVFQLVRKILLTELESPEIKNIAPEFCYDPNCPTIDQLAQDRIDSIKFKLERLKLDTCE